MAMLAIALVFAVVAVWTATAKTKTIVSNKPAHTHTDEKETLPRNEPLAFKEEERVRHAAGVRDTAEIQQEHLDHLEAMQRQMAQAPGRAPSSPPDIISDVDLQQLKTLAAQGSPWAQSQLGQLYANGRGVPQDYATARGWYEKAAAQGNTWAQAQLGQLYANGRGVPQDNKKARQWWEQAALQGNAQAQFNLGQLYANGRGVPQDYAAARGWYEKAAAQGNAWAQAQLGQLYANGQGVPQDYETARGWYEKAAARGNAWAQAQLALL
jgi:TPR repeat protein